ncbi:MAG: hydrolase TatD [Xanthomonadales bacterium]|nr:TatD family hydrolase [Gammaproteobacteria bacterium]MBT8054345.1 TatD family hydrolase [Gammaproteobacteria bacterium]NND57462.1 hydrolase TatD [Xanthomonadales bacterium]NNK51186.1 hydrolase TatD [Xanthomonadales bacterium]
MEMIDIGCNLTHDSFDSDRDKVLQRAREAGVAQMIITGASEDGSKAALKIAREHEGELFATAGVHPHRASVFSDETEALLRQLCQEKEVVAVGETGLDYFRDFSPRDDQRKAFQRQLQIGIDSGLPLFLHMRDAHGDFHPIVREVREQLSNVVVHCFTGSREELRDYLDLDCHIGITGWICDERRGTHMKEFLQDIPANRLMIETDAPYLKPRNLRPRVKSHRNEPCWLPWILGTLAAARNEHPPVLAEQTTVNARRFFRIPECASK